MKPLQITDHELEYLKQASPFLWLNPAYQKPASVPVKPAPQALYEAEARLERFAPLLAKIFPELKSHSGKIESPLIQADKLNSEINSLGGSLLLKADHDLPVAGSIKARGGIYEVLCFAEALALQHGLIKDTEDDYLLLGSETAKVLFSKYSIVVGSTGNLGLSIGVIGTALGFTTVVHMSADAKAWKKARLKKLGVKVVEHQSDYGAAVEAGRREAEQSACHYFIDDEQSQKLFMGYAVAALRLKAQLEAANITVDAKHPLFVYLPAGVGGAPGGITYGLKLLFGDNVHCFFGEPVQAPCLLLGIAGRAHSQPASVYTLGLTIDTDADGLAVGRASQWVCDATRDLISGIYTATDKQLYQQLCALNRFEKSKVEPSAAIGCLGPSLLQTKTGRSYLVSHQLTDCLKNSTHIVWLTGGSFVPDKEYKHYLEKSSVTNTCAKV